MAANNALDQFIKSIQEQERLRAKPFPLKTLLSLYLNSCSKIPFNDFLLLISWLSPIDSPVRPSTYFQAFNTFEIQQIAAACKVNPAEVQSVFMELYNESQSRLRQSN